MISILAFVIGAALLVYCAEKLIVHLVGAAAGLHISVFLLAIIFTGIEFDDVALGVALNLDDLDGVALGTVFGTAISMTGIVLALAAIISPTRVDIPRPYLILFAGSPLVMVPFALTGTLTASDGVVLLLLFAAFIGYVARQELRSTTPIFRNAEILEMAGAPGERPVSSALTDEPPFRPSRPLPDWAGVGLAVLALVGLVGAAAITSQGIKGILDDFSIEGTLFGATIATLALSIEDIFLTVEPNRRGASELGIIVLNGGNIKVGNDVLVWHLPVLVVMTGLGAYFISTGRLRRRDGFLLLALYIAYWIISYTLFGEAPIDD